MITLPEGVTPPSEKEMPEPGSEEDDQSKDTGGASAEKKDMEIDLEKWRGNRPKSVTITIQSNHYYNAWLPLTRDMQRMCPPLRSGTYMVIFHHWFGGEEGSFPAWVEWEQKRILGDRGMYQAFYDHGIYPGARLVISHRGNEFEYDIRTTPPVDEGKKIIIKRVSLTQDGNLEYSEDEEPVQYDIAEDVFVAAARWEDLEALFRQAEEAGAGIFELMFEKCVQWWEENDRQPLYVTAQDLFDAIHYDDHGRLTSKATIAWEMWRRTAFEPVGGGRYLFKPGQGGRLKYLGTTKGKRKTQLPAEKVSSGTPQAPEMPPGRSARLRLSQAEDVVLVTKSESRPVSHANDALGRLDEGSKSPEIREQSAHKQLALPLKSQTHSSPTGREEPTISPVQNDKFSQEMVLPESGTDAAPLYDAYVRIKEAFRTLLAYLRRTLDLIQKAGEKAMQEKRFDVAQNIAKRADEVQAQTRKLEALERRFPEYLQETFTVPDGTVEGLGQLPLEVEEALPRALYTVISVCREVWYEGRSYNEAVKVTQHRRGLSSVHTVYDACTRRIQLNTAGFRRLLGDPEALSEHLKQRYPKYQREIDYYLFPEGEAHGTK